MSRHVPNTDIVYYYRHRLPLLQAYIQENIRYKTVNPLLLAHETIRDTEIAGYKVCHWFLFSSLYHGLPVLSKVTNLFTCVYLLLFYKAPCKTHLISIVYQLNISPF